MLRLAGNCRTANNVTRVQGFGYRDSTLGQCAKLQPDRRGHYAL
jgi:hypothetical protein